MAKVSNDYNPTQIEAKWAKVWYQSSVYRAVDFDEKKKFYALVEFPYPTGEGLHIGHAFTNTLMDVLARKKRMDGFNVMQPMGWDAFGLPAENYAIKTGQHPTVTVEKNTRRFREQNNRLGISYDWEREINTTDSNYYRWTQWIFLKLFKHGLAYKKEMPINWCPSCRIGLANEEVVGGKCERCGAPAGQKNLSQWLLRITVYADRLIKELDLVDYPDYVKASQRNWIGRKEWIDINYPIEGTKQTISVSTTRPDTNFGATFIVLAPEHPLVGEILSGQVKAAKSKRTEIENYVAKAQKKSELERISEGRQKTGVDTGLYAINQLDDRRLPIWITDFVLMDIGTGAVVGVPGHDRRDFEFAQQFNLPVIRVVVGADGDRSEITQLEQVQEKAGTMINSDFLDGMAINDAIEVMMAYLEKKGWGERTIRCHLRDWIFSRQHYWGEPIPMVYCPTCAGKGIRWADLPEAATYRQKMRELGVAVPEEGVAGWFPIDESQLPLKLPAVEKYQPTGTGESPLAAVSDWVAVRCPHCGGKARRETDTMPNWAASSWYFLRYCDPDGDKSLADPQKLNYWLPVDIYLGGAEHNTLHLLYSRFWHKFLNDVGVVPGKEPYAARRQHGVILGENGRRMSKSRGNVINPEKTIAEFGADTLRVYLLFMGPYEAIMPWNFRGVAGCRRFLDRVWRLVVSQDKTTTTPKSLTGPLHRLIKKVGDDIEVMKFNTAIAAMMEFTNQWVGEGPALSVEGKITFLRLLAPLAPFITEELYQYLRGDGGEFVSIHSQPWPSFDEKLAAEASAAIVIQINGKTRGTISVPRAKVDDQAEVEKLVAKEPAFKKHSGGRKINRVIYIPGRVINYVLEVAG